VSVFAVTEPVGNPTGVRHAGGDVLAALEPQAFWRHFETLTTIPRPSRVEEPVIEHVRLWAEQRGFELQQDVGRNLVIRVPASTGREAAPTLILQGHLDMVCERDPTSPNDPAEGRIALLRDGDWLTADGTTLGADDGIAIAAMMALVEDESLPHGPLELLMTVAEEVGLEGANDLDGSLLTGSTLLNLDSEEDGTLTVGCAGSTDTWVRLDAARAAGDELLLLDRRLRERARADVQPRRADVRDGHRVRAHRHRSRRPRRDVGRAGGTGDRARTPAVLGARGRVTALLRTRSGQKANDRQLISVATRPRVQPRARDALSATPARDIADAISQVDSGSRDRPVSSVTIDRVELGSS
jgi:hypothetical protein